MNSVNLTGFIANDIIFREVPKKNSHVCHFLLQVKLPYAKGKVRPVNVPVKVWGKGAIACANYARKGSRIAVNGFLDLRIRKINAYEQDNNDKWIEKEITFYDLHVLTYGVEFISDGVTDEELLEQGYTAPDADIFEAFNNLYGSDKS